MVGHWELRQLIVVAPKMQSNLSYLNTALESSLGVTLIDRTSKGLVLAPIGMELVEHANSMLASANSFASRAVGQTQTLDGTVRLTASDLVANFLLPELIAKLRQVAPQIQIEIVSSDEPGNLLKREADIAIRMFRPNQQDIITKNLGNIHLGLFASRDYIKRNGEPDSMETFSNHDLVGYDTNSIMIDGMGQCMA